MPKGRRGWTLEERIMDKVIINNVSGCYEWQGATNNIGYGMIRVSNSEGMKTAHRALYEIANNTHVPHDLCVLHTCNNYKCINPAHMKVGTRKDLSEAMIISGRHNFFGGTTRKGHVTPKLKCVHCDRMIAKNLIDRWHNDNCKNKP